MVFALVFARGSVNAVDNPTRQSFVIEMVGSERLVNAVSLNSVIVHSSRIVGPALAGLLIATAGVEPCFLLNAATFAAMIVALSGMESPTLRTPRRGRARAGRAARCAALCPRHAGACGPAGDDGARRDARLQLPGAAAVAGQVELRGRSATTYAAAGRRDGRSARSPARSPPAPAAASRADPDRRPRAAFGRFTLLAAARADAGARARRAGAARRGQRDVRRRRQLDACSSRSPRRCAAG